MPYGFRNLVIIDLAPLYNVFGTGWKSFVKLLKPGASASLRLNYLLLFSFPIRTELETKYIWSTLAHLLPVPPQLFLYRITELFGLAGTFKGHLLQPVYSEQGHLQLDQVA